MKIMNDQLVPKNFIMLLEKVIELHELKITDIIFIYDSIANIGEYFHKTKKIVINLRRIPEKIPEYGYGLLNFKAALWASLLKTGLEKVRHAYQWQKLNAEMMGPKWADKDADEWSDYMLRSLSKVSPLLWMPKLSDMGVFSIMLEKVNESETFFAADRETFSHILTENILRKLPEKLTFKDFFNTDVSFEDVKKEIIKKLKDKIGETNDICMYKM